MIGEIIAQLVRFVADLLERHPKELNTGEVRTEIARLAATLASIDAAEQAELDAAVSPER